MNALIQFQRSVALAADGIAGPSTLSALGIWKPPLSACPASNRPTVYLTFDDGPSAYTPQILALLRRYGAVATFFVVGLQVRDQPQMVAQTASAGHTIENHTWSHPNLTQLQADGIRSQLLAVNQVVRSVIGRIPKFFRPPYGATNTLVRAVAAQVGLTEVLWTIDPWDWNRPGAATIASRVLSRVTNGSIILLHDGGGDRSQTVAALEIILPELNRRGYATAVLCR